MSSRAIHPDDSLLRRVMELESRVRILERGGTNKLYDHDFTPTWTGSIGNGQLISSLNFISGSCVLMLIQVIWGSTTSHPASEQVFVTDSSDIFVPDALWAVSAMAFDNSAGRYYTGVSRVGWVTGEIHVEDGTTNIRTYFGGPAVGMSNGVPFTWGTDDELVISGIFRGEAGLV